MDKLKQLLSRCKCGVYLTVNEHRDVYNSTVDALGDFADRECPPEINAEVQSGIFRTGNIVELQFYPETPIGSYTIVDYDIDRALDRALQCLEP